MFDPDFSAHKGLVHPAKAGASATVSGPVHSNGKSVDQRAAGKRLDQRFRDARVAAQLLGNAGGKLAKAGLAVACCRHVPFASEIEGQRAETSAWLKGIQTCSKVWLCPCCSAVISRQRRDELNTLLAAARQEGLAVAMLVLTASHKCGMNLKEWLSSFRKAQKTLWQRREWRAFKPDLVGTVAATEVTHSDRNAWHAHVHLLVIMRCPQAEAVARLDALFPAWQASLTGVGLSASRKGWRVDPAEAAGDYFGKWGAAEELTLSSAKQARAPAEAEAKGRTPWQILSDIAEAGKHSSPRDRALWLEFAEAFHGRRQLVWSKGLKARFGIGELTDAEAAESEGLEAEPDQVETFRTYTIEQWHAVRGRKAAILRAAIRRESIDAAEFGPTDAERWQRAAQSPLGSVIEPE